LRWMFISTSLGSHSKRARAAGRICETYER
jgi:hypothetical protein